MEQRRLRKTILELIGLRNLAGTSYEHIVTRIASELRGQGVTKSKVESELSGLIKSGVLKRTKKDKNNSVVEYAEAQLQGTLFVFGKKGGYIVPTNSSEKLPVTSYACTGFKTGDVVSFVKNQRGEVVISKKVSSQTTTNTGIDLKEKTIISGHIFKDELGRYQFYPQDKKKYPETMTVINDIKKFGNVEGCVVTCELNPVDPSLVSLTKVVGRIGDPLPETNALAMEAGINLQPNPLVDAELTKIPSEVDTSLYNLTDEAGNCPAGKDPAKNDYVDLRNKMFTTIDPFDCRDMDDSVYTELDEDGNFVTYTAIADVTEYIKPGSEIWKQALKQGFTLYTPYDSYPMIPKVLSHGILSLNPEVDRLTLCAKTVIDRNTGMRIPGKTQIMHAVINSKKKFSYNEVQAMADANNLPKIVDQIRLRTKLNGSAQPQNLLECVALNRLCADKVWDNFKSRGMLNFNRNDEKQFTVSKDGTKVLDIKPYEHLKSMELIEALMINANEAFAEYTRDNKLNSVYRTHDKPNMEKVERFKAMMGLLGMEYTGNGDNVSMQKLLNETKDNDYREVIKEFALRTQAKAKYSNQPHPVDDLGREKEDTECHSALRSECYTHFTSGIRRMSDLIVQYAIKEHLRGHKQPFSEEYVTQVAALVSSLEINIDDTEHKINDMYAAIWAEDHINDVMEGKISNFGPSYVTVENEDTGIKVNVPTEEFGKDGKVDEFGISLMDKNGKQIKKLCDKITFKISGADRVGRMVYASTDLTKNYTNMYTPEYYAQFNLNKAKSLGKLDEKYGKGYNRNK